MSVSLASDQAQHLLAAHADASTPLASDPFAVGPGMLLILLMLGFVLLAAIGQVLTLVWAVVRQALPLLGLLLLGLTVVVLVGMGSVTQPGTEPASPAPTADRSTPQPTTGPAKARPTTRASHSVPPSSLAPLGVPSPR